MNQVVNAIHFIENAIDIVIAGAPTSKGRPRFSRRSGRAFTPSKTMQAEDTLAGRALVALAPWRERLPLQGPLVLCAVFTLPVPKSWSKKDRAAALDGSKRPTGKPDVDNLVKLATDALNGVVWVDDSQLVSVTMSKCYGDVPSTRLIVGGA